MLSSYLKLFLYSFRMLLSFFIEIISFLKLSVAHKELPSYLYLSRHKKNNGGQSSIFFFSVIIY